MKHHHRKINPMILYFLLSAILWGAMSIPAAAVSDAEPDLRYPAKSFKVVGYYSGDLFDEPIENLPTDQLTHIIYAFLIPKADGSLEPLAKPEQLRALTAQAHQDGAKVFIALGGWSYNNAELAPVFEQLAAAEGSRAALVENVRQFIRDYGLDGLELDWEHPNAFTIGDYEQLAVELKSALVQDRVEFTAALNGAWSATEGPQPSMVLTDKCLRSFDFINVMGYDINNEDHSPLWFTATSIDYWLNRGVPAEDIVIGMPLYARPSWMQYRHLVELNPDYAYTEYITVILDGRELVCSAEDGLGVPFIDEHDRVMIPLRKLLEAIGAQVRYEESTRTVCIEKEGVTLLVPIEQYEMILNGQAVTTDAPAIIKDGRTYVPVRAILSAFDYEVNWHDNSHSAYFERR